MRSETEIRQALVHVLATGCNDEDIIMIRLLAWVLKLPVKICTRLKPKPPRRRKCITAVDHFAI
jgi:hypothetical protein